MAIVLVSIIADTKEYLKAIVSHISTYRIFIGKFFLDFKNKLCLMKIIFTQFSLDSQHFVASETSDVRIKDVVMTGKCRNLLHLPCLSH